MLQKIKDFKPLNVKSKATQNKYQEPHCINLSATLLRTQTECLFFDTMSFHCEKIFPLCAFCLYE